MWNEQLTTQDLMMQNEVLSKEIRFTRLHLSAFLLSSTIIIYVWFADFALSRGYPHILRAFIVMPIMLNMISWLYAGLYSFRMYFLTRSPRDLKRFGSEPEHLYFQHEHLQVVFFREMHLYRLIVFSTSVQFVMMGALVGVLVIAS